MHQQPRDLSSPTAKSTHSRSRSRHCLVWLFLCVMPRSPRQSPVIECALTSLRPNSPRVTAYDFTATSLPSPFLPSLPLSLSPSSLPTIKISFETKALQFGHPTHPCSYFLANVRLFSPHSPPHQRLIMPSPGSVTRNDIKTRTVGIEDSESLTTSQPSWASATEAGDTNLIIFGVAKLQGQVQSTNYNPNVHSP